MATTVNYKNTTLTTVTNQTKVLKTGGTWLEDDIEITDVTSGGSAVVVTEEDDEHGGIIKHITAVDLSNDTVSAATLLQGYTAHNYLGEAITGTYSGGTFQEKTVTPTTAAQNITADYGYNGLSKVTVNAIPSQYIVPTGSLNITSNNTYDVTNYASAVVNVSSTVNNQNKTVSPTESQQQVTADSGYTGLGTVTVDAISDTYVGSAIDRRDDTDLTVSGAIITAPAGYYADAASKSVSSATQATPVISVDNTTGIITATSTQTAGYITAGTKSATEQLTTQAAKTVNPTESEQTVVNANVYTTGIVKVGAISSTYVGSDITQRDSSDLTVSGATVTAPIGYYASSASKSVSSMTLPTAASSTSSGTNKATIGRSTSAQYINIPTGYNSTASYYTISATPNGSVTAPSSISGTSATLSIGTNTLTLTKTISVTPNVTTAGYISSGTAGNTSVSLTANITTQGASTITPSTSSQTAVASGVYTTGAVTVAAIPSQYKDLSTATTGTAADLLYGETLYDSTGRLLVGTLQFVTYYTGSSAPSSSIGNNGDIYLQEA